MKISELMVMLVLFSALSIGFANFYIGTATSYATESEELEEFVSYFNQSSYIDQQMQEIHEKFSSFDPTNPLTWGNFVSTMINVFNIIISLPGQINSIMVYVTNEIFFLPGWFPGVIYLLVFVIVLFAGISAINKYRV